MPPNLAEARTGPPPLPHPPGCSRLHAAGSGGGEARLAFHDNVYSATRNFLNLTCHQRKNNVILTLFHNRKLGRDSAGPSGPSSDGTEKSGGGA
uniref:Uncharacterized protein n=1 Tax=Oryza barthii TaxID=65489 RepID=A0A0D3FSJ7_9ORYZ